MKGKAYATRQARKVLNQFNSAHGIDQNSGNFETDVRKVAEHLRITVIPYDFSDSISGVFFRKGGNLYLGVNKNQHEHRQRFSVAHEIGHYILHSHETLHYDRELNDGDRFLFRADNISSYDETEANHFAAELLMPEDLVREQVNSGISSITELAGKFNVSDDAMRYRLVNLGYL